MGNVTLTAAALVKEMKKRSLTQCSRLISTGAQIGTIQHAREERLFRFDHSLLCVAHSLLCVAQCSRSCVTLHGNDGLS